MTTNEDARGPVENKKESFEGVSKCYVFKSRLQEYAQKKGLKTPVYETIKEGPSHEPSFKSTVTVNDVKYDSLLGFTNRKTAEQSAAEVALVELSKSGDVDESISQPIHESGLCKNLLQEYAQKMNYAIPLYQCEKSTSVSKVALYSCNVEVGGIKYIGALAKSKKEAEVKAARTALLAVWLSKSESSMGSEGSTQLTVLPSKRKRTEETAVPKPKKAPRPKRLCRRKPHKENAGKTRGQDATELKVPGEQSNSYVEPVAAKPMPQNSVENAVPGEQSNSYVEPVAAKTMPQNSVENAVPGEQSNSYVEPVAARNLWIIPYPHPYNVWEIEQPNSYFNLGNYHTQNVMSYPLPAENITPLAMELNVESARPYSEASGVMPDFHQSQ